MATLVIGVTGKKRAGKDTFARRLIEHHGFTRVAFADALKAVMSELDPVIPVHLDETGVVWGPGSEARWGTTRLKSLVTEVGWEKAKEVREVRRLLQAHGDAIRRHTDPDIWVNAVRQQVGNTPGPVVLTDVRYPNEAEFITENAGRLVRVVRGGQLLDDNHITETALDKWPVNAQVGNDGAVSALHAKADELVDYWYNHL
ncbi:hypothetical protein [Amycolatopsis sp. PS_44_ISF1]|uniref:deoxynucleotide monophosphate kinase family protein n=1 Tax=Amycolatopsis sp. PS_44_ISF1 TaxID=2974917 RepID=UPI0028DFD483|nr:hypothetical protein [Amycolatopsis sp. PS_44_ISF1]MDT8915773.1 hypothetical protein [Amycolatopsis sp. PS_44_ISF1]MDT8916356.1 hypothetical protein [Amycolatopsis sp. PS_44_ISF1]